MNILMPRSLLLRHPQLAANLQRNQGRITSHYDFYLTIRHLTRYQHKRCFACALCTLQCIVLSVSPSGRWPEAEATSDMGLPFKDARSLMSEMPLEREVSGPFSFVHILQPLTLLPRRQCSEIGIPENYCRCNCDAETLCSR
jgi:hypothetical protein